MRKRSLLMFMLCALLTFSLCAGALTTDVSAAKTSNKSNSSNSKNNTLTDTENENAEPADGSETDADKNATLTDSQEESDSSSKSNNKKKTTTKNTQTAKSSSQSTTDWRGFKLLMTESQRRSKFRSKTNPKRGVKPSNVTYKPNFNGFTYADFGTLNSYNSENGLGYSPIYLLGTITGIEKVSENDTYYGTVLLVNDCDGYQWYMRVDIAKGKYDGFRSLFLKKTGYIYGTYAGYSGVTNRPMMDVTVIHVNDGVPVNMKLYQ